MGFNYGVIRIRANSSIAGQSVTIQSEDGNFTTSAVLAVPYVDVHVASMRSYYVIYNNKRRLVDVNDGGITAVTASHGGIIGPTGDAVVYGFKVSKDAVDPDSRVIYTDDCEQFLPAHMDYDNDSFDYGSWEDAFFMPRPCMLKSDGTVDYYLDPDDYSKREDGTASDISNQSYAGNAMMQWPKIYVSRTEDSQYYYTRISNVKADANFNCFTNHDANGNEIDYFYTAIYNGCNVNGKLRSLSGQTILNGATGTTEISYALANNSSGQYADNGWYIEQWVDRALINDLLTLIGKTTNTQEVFGNGHYTGGSAASNLLKSGTLNDKGLFYGTNGTGVAVKVFGMENYWGNQWRRCAGLITSNQTLYAKMTWGKEDGTTRVGYQTASVDGYHKIGKSVGGTSGGYISAVTNGKFGRIPVTASGSEQAYECDGLWFSSNVGVGFARVGSCCSDSWMVGAFALILSDAVSYSNWYIGAALSCKPLAEE